MEKNSYVDTTNKYFTKWNLLLIISGLIINVLLSKIVNIFHLPLFLDTLGTILVGALGGFIPGMLVGLFTNLINSIFDKIMIYYGILSVVIGALSTIFFEKGYFKSKKGVLVIIISFVLITGVAGVSISWFINDSNIGGTSIVIGNYFNNLGLTPYLAQLFADLIIELPDKTIMLSIAYLIFKYCPVEILNKFPLGYMYTIDINKLDIKVKKSISKRVTYIVMMSIFISCIFSIIICLVFYMQRIKTSCEDFALVVSRQAAGYVDGDNIPIFLTEGSKNTDYNKTKANLEVLYNNSSKVEYLFVYAIYEDGVHVVFDLDTPNLKGEKPGTILEPEQGISLSYQEYIDGKEIPIEYSNGEYGNILTVYTRIYNSNSQVVAYAGVDINMKSYYNEFALFAMQVISIIFAMTLLIFTFVLWYINKHIAKPIQIIVHQTEQLKNISPELWLDSKEWKNQIKLTSQDELAQLNDTVNQLEKKAALSMKQLIETKQELLETKKLAEINEQLEIAIKKAKEANEAKTNFLARMSHDMRTPLNGILNFSKFINESESLIEAKEYGSKILASGNYLQTLINDTLGMSRIESGKVVLKLEPYSYYEFESSIKNVLEQKAIEKGIDLKFIPPKSIDKALLFDHLRLQQVCINILNNAIKFTNRNGKVIFETKKLFNDENNETIQFIISDTGIGMSKKFMKEQLFKPFAQEQLGRDNEETGTGLGLSIAKQLVEIMGGSIDCTSEVGKGTVFTITISAPIVKDVSKKVEDKIDLDKLNGIHVLLCEDHYLNREIVVKLLVKQGCIVDVVENGKLGVDKFISNSDYYDIILMDIRMPVMDGISATKTIRDLDSDKANTIPIIALTANAYNDDKIECFKAGMNDHIAKPIEVNELYKTIIRHIDREE